MRFKVTGWQPPIQLHSNQADCSGVKDCGQTRLGDVIASLAEPVKRVAIRVTRGKLRQWIRNCNCNKRKEFLNSLFQ